MRRRTWMSRLFLIAAAMTAVMIFCFSAQSGEESAELSNGITDAVVTIVYRDTDKVSETVRRQRRQSVSMVIRKNAHLSEFMLLGFTLAMGLWLRKDARPSLKVGALAWSLGALYAASDELHQRFVSDRGPELRDVGIDAAGVLLGCLLAALVLSRLARRHRKE